MSLDYKIKFKKKKINIEFDRAICPICKKETLISGWHKSVGCGVLGLNEWRCNNSKCKLNKSKEILVDEFK